MEIVNIKVSSLRPYEKNANYFVYKHTFPNGKVYVGITSQKYITHRWQSGKGYKNQEMMYNAILKYGWDNIKHEILFKNLTQEEAFEKEKYLIKAYRSDERKFGYNIRHGGDANKGYKLSKETRRKMSEARKGNRNHMFGKHMTKEVKQKLSELKKRKINQYTINGEFVCTYNSMIEIARQYNVTRQNIYACCSGRRKTACGFIWRYAND